MDAFEYYSAEFPSGNEEVNPIVEELIMRTEIKRAAEQNKRKMGILGDPPSKKAKTEDVKLRVSSELKQYLQDKADIEEGGNVSRLIVKALQQHFGLDPRKYR